MSSAATRKAFKPPAYIVAAGHEVYAELSEQRTPRGAAQTDVPSNLVVVEAEVLGATKGKGRRSRAPTIAWTEERLLVLLQTAITLDYPRIFFKGVVLQHGKKACTMEKMREQLLLDKALFPRVPLAETLDRWIEEAVGKWIKVRSTSLCSLVQVCSLLDCHCLLPAGAWKEQQCEPHWPGR